MKILIAEDDPISRRLLEVTLVKWGYNIVMTCDGAAAWRILEGEDPPPLAILDWMMPGMEGVEICRRIRETPSLALTYVLLLTAKDRREDVIAGLTAGANDYLTKPFNREELQARLRVGANVVGLQTALAARVRDLEEALSRVRQLQGLLPICAYCKKIRSDGNYWQQVENYIADHTDVQFSHGICPDCYTRLIQPELDQMSRVAATEAGRSAEDDGSLQGLEPEGTRKGGDTMTIDELAHSLNLETKDCLELLHLFFDATDGDLGRMRSALAREDAPAFERAAHSIKGASLSLGLAEIGEVAREAEVRARELRLGDLPFLLEEIRRKAVSAAGAFSCAIPGSRSPEGAERETGREYAFEDFQEESHP